jgi:acetoin utilization deacetylase AcuC-like enzyme
VCPASFDVARAAVGGVFVAIDQVMLREVDRAMALVRPPGHHATADQSMGFCLFNNVALGARYAQQRHGLGKILVVDFDVHHGNGTQAIFEEDPSVFVFSMHRWPFYPGTGAADRKGTGAGAGFTFNLPLPATTKRETVVSLFEQSLADIAERFTPEIVLVSAGFDAYQDDPIAGLNLAPSDFRAMTDAIVALADKACSGRVVSALEGGYDLRAIGACVEQHLRALGA